MAAIIKGYLKTVAITATTLHDGSNGLHRDKVENFQIQVPSTSVEVILGAGDLTDSSNGLIIQPGQTLDFTPSESRRTPNSYNLKQMFYLGGPFTLILQDKDD